jgi:hypothetical protein
MTLIEDETNDHMICLNDLFIVNPTLQTMSIFNAIKRAVPDCKITIKDTSGIESKFNFEVRQNNGDEFVFFETYSTRPFLFRIKTNNTEIDESSLISQIVNLNNRDVYCKNKINGIIDAFNNLNITQELYSKFNNVANEYYTKQNEGNIMFCDTSDSLKTVGKVHYKGLGEESGLSVGIVYYCHTAICDDDKICNIYHLNIANCMVTINTKNLEMKIMKDRNNAFHMEYLKDDESAEAFDETMVEALFHSILTKRVTKLLSIDHVDNEIYSYEELKDSLKIFEMVLI